AAAGLRRELPDVGEGGAGPFAAAGGLRFRDRLLDVRVVGQLVERYERGRPLAEQRRRRGDHGRPGRGLGAGVDLQVGLDPVAAGESDRLDPAHAHPAQHYGIAHAQSPDRAEAGRVDRLRAPEVRAGEPQRARDHDGERGDHHHPDGELVLALHVGRPSMNCRTTGSSVSWIWATVPTCRILPSYNMAMRYPTV